MYDAAPAHGRSFDHDFGSAAPLTRRRSIVVVSDWVDGWPPASPARRDEAAAARRWRSLDHADRPWIDPPVAPVAVAGGYL